ncbi:Fic family protein [Neolewinella antarctica]|uniref:Fic family protein n=1 Tax=Neolewinella antarctica TaxID=442734 RepID=A0ABX0XF11_9BACT|nr:Fic family protein [Neolewinella antarctica]NJC27909.1 Fic family protein [Neolewinella antarctica]
MLNSYKIPVLPLSDKFLDAEILLAMNAASRKLAELKGIARTLPNERILTTTLILREAQNSSAVENIISTKEEIYRAELKLDGQVSSATKEVLRYADALRFGFERVSEHGIITRNTIIAIQGRLEFNNAGIRRTPGTKLMNSQTGEVVYEPPQHPDHIETLLDNLVNYMNDDLFGGLDPLIRMAILHHNFESIHPFYDGNGRTGRILNILYLVKEKLLDLPILYLSGYIIKSKGEYYRLLQGVRDEGLWKEWIIYMLNGVKETAHDSIELIGEISKLMHTYKIEIRARYPKMYSQDLINNLFRQPYTKLEFLAKELVIHKNTARTYTNQLVDDGFLSRHKVGRTTYFVNDRLFTLLSR